MTCPNSDRLWPQPTYCETGKLTYFRLTWWWHFRSWLASFIGWAAYRLIAPKDPEVNNRKRESPGPPK